MSCLDELGNLESRCRSLLSIAVHARDSIVRDTDCVAFGPASLCVASPIVRQHCMRVERCTLEASPRPSLVGLFGMVEYDETLFAVVSAACWVCFVLTIMGWVFIVSRALFGCVTDVRSNAGLVSWQRLKHLLSLSALRLYLDPLRDLPEEAREAANRILQSRRISRFRSASKAAAFVLPVLLALAIPQNLPMDYCPGIGGSCWERQLWWHQRFASRAVGVALLTGLCVLSTAFPGILGGGYLVATHVAMYVGVAWHFWDVSSQDDLQLQQGVLVYFRIALAVIDGDTKVVALLNTMLLFLKAVVPTLKLVDWRWSCLHALVIILLTGSLEYTRCDLVRQVMFVEESSEEAATVQGLLSMMCDAVAELRKLQIAAACPKLAALLLRSPSDGLRGRSFLDLVDPLDRERCSSALLSDSKHCVSLHIRLLAGAGTTVRVQLFIAARRSLSRGLHHIVGIREENDPGAQQMADAPAQQQITWDQSGGGVGATAQTGDLRDEDRESVLSGRRLRGSLVLPSVPEESVASGTDGPDALPVLDMPPFWPQLPIIWVAFNETLDLRRMTRAFANAIGTHSILEDRHSVRNWIVSKSRGKVIDWLTSILDKPVRNVGASRENVKLELPGLQGSIVKCTLVYLFVYAKDHENIQDAEIAFFLMNMRMQTPSKPGLATETRLGL
eukprot:TRINITY_DN101937_c0_g1_i1.p1 TRINITY_DN101937_c0_g1~~TRINITY_DN101937_c0_g1_i1.p1  ORF type:complete len:674 (+),score=59.92 TRINITY_DN101937_c0_g1_i1:136-2157(+)